jgi:hypothetical protein
MKTPTSIEESWWQTALGGLAAALGFGLALLLI